ncbi:MAG: TonB-dependent receptor [Bacteroidales bacterium]|nr:TonB-dependent receptor [Bacteroidales bacterium]
MSIKEMRAKSIKYFIALWLQIFLISANQTVGSTLKGRVTDTNGNPLAGAGVTIIDTFFGVYTSADGTYVITGLRDGSYKVRATFLGFEPRIVEVTVSGDTVLDILLEQASYMTDEVIVSATRAGMKSPLAFNTIERDLLQKQNSGHDLPFLLSLTPSLVETSEAGTGIGYTNLRIRGSDASRINVTLDGIPLNDPESQQVFWVDLPDLASSVENIQIQRGVGTSSNGAGAFGASINIRTKTISSDPFAEVSSSAGSFGTFKNTVSLGTGYLSGRFAFQARYSDLKSKGYVDRTGSDHRSAFITGAFRGERSLLKANVILGEEHTGIGWWGVPREILAVNRRYNPAGEYTDENGNLKYYENESDNYFQNHYQLFHSLKLNDYLSLNSAIHYTKGKGYYEEYKEDRDLADYGLPNLIINGFEISESDLVRRKWMSNDFYGLIYSLNYRKEKIEAVTGGGFNRYAGDHYGRIIWMEYAGQVPIDYQWYLNNGVKKEINLFGKLNYMVSGKISVFGDLQFRHIGYRITGNDDDLRDISQSHNFNFINPKTGIFLSINPNQDAFLSFSIANREPTRADFKEAAGDNSATPRPETLYDTELGYRIRSGQSTLALNLYGMFYKDQLVPTGELSNTGYSIMTNVERSYRIGAEISLGIKPSENVRWDFNMTLSRNRIPDFVEYYIDYNTSDWSAEYKSKNLGTVDIAYSPSVISSSDLAFKVFPILNIHLISKYVGKQYFDNTMSRDRMIDPYFVNNVRIDFEPRSGKIKGTEIQFFINNILNNKYESNAYGGNWYEDGNEKTWAYFFPQAGINYMMRISLRF